MKKLFSPYNLDSLELANRVVMAPMTRTRTENNVPTELTALYYAQRASAGLIITEGLPISDEDVATCIPRESTRTSKPVPGEK